ncbi:MAG: phosphotransferase [Symploca sp. SIO2E6]|nr:phosphotransferase [Symploca sp. SIO2E6]
MSNFVVQVYKNANSNKAPAINLPTNLPQQELINPELIKAAQGLFAANGVLLINHLFSQELIASLYQSFVDRYQFYFADQNYANVLEVGDKRKMLTIDFQTPFNNPELYGNPFLLYLMRELLGTGFVLGSFGAVISLPGAQHQHIHRDHPPLFEDEELDVKIPSFAITVVVPLIDLTPATGSTRVWKGSHRIPDSQSLEAQDSFVPFLPMGSCYLMDYQLLHGGTPNVSDLVRPILYLNYYRYWFQEAVNYEKQSRISITKQEYQKIPEPYKFLFERVKEYHKFTHPLAVPVDYDQTPKDFRALTSTEQAQKLGELAKTALASYGFSQAQLKLIAHGDNTVFAVALPETSLEGGDAGTRGHGDAGMRRIEIPPPISFTPNNSPYLANRFILRIHRGNYLSVDAIESELRWLQYLCHEAQLPVPEPIPTLEGQLYTIADAPEIAESRVCSLTRCLKGQPLDQDSPINLELVGQLMGKLHNYGAYWSIPENFTRPRWNWNGLFGDGAGYSNQGNHVWELTPQPYRSFFRDVSSQIKAIMASLGEETDQFGLIHGDFWSGNLLVFDQEIYPIDFADCGFGYWGYEVARFLSDFPRDQNWALCLDQLLSGYTQIRAFPEKQLPHISTFVAAHYVTLALWQINRAQEHPSFRSNLEEDLQETVEEVEAWLAE